MTELNIGDVFEMAYPFYDQFHDAPTSDSWLIPGCEMTEEEDGGWGLTRFYNAKYEGKIVYKVLSIAKMPGKYMDRIIFKKHYIEPNGKKFSDGNVCVLTRSKFESNINSYTPFPVDYEVEFDEYKEG